jgi:1,4-dihydroxy-2-naphthoyl-CoA synthase
VAAGAGASIAMACDIVIAAPQASFTCCLISNSKTGAGMRGNRKSQKLTSVGFCFD